MYIIFKTLSLQMFHKERKHRECLLNLKHSRKCKHNYVYKKTHVINSHFLRYQSNLIGLSIVITTSKYVHVSIHVAAAGPRHGGRDVPIHVKHLPSEKWKKKRKMQKNCLYSLTTQKSNSPRRVLVSPNIAEMSYDSNTISSSWKTE